MARLAKQSNCTAIGTLPRVSWKQAIEATVAYIAPATRVAFIVIKHLHSTPESQYLTDVKVSIGQQ